jgi:hypothetical protein
LITRLPIEEKEGAREIKIYYLPDFVCANSLIVPSTFLSNSANDNTNAFCSGVNRL